MKITKEDALILVKLLHAYDSRSYAVPAGKTEFQETVEDLCERLDDFIVNGEEDDDDYSESCHDGSCIDCSEQEEDEEDDDEGDEDDDEEEEDSGEEDEEDDEESDEDEESSEEDDGDDSEDEEELNADSYARGDELHALKAVKSTDGSVEFELVEDDSKEDEPVELHVDLLVNGYTELESVTHVRRKGKELHVRDGEGEWYTFDVTKFSKDWIAAFPVGDLVEVEA